MSELSSKIESILFVESKPLTIKKLAQICGCVSAEVQQALADLRQNYQERHSGVNIVYEGENVQLMTAAPNADLVSKYLHSEENGELTRPSLETLTIIAYRGPVAKSEIELIRGVNCSLILPNYTELNQNTHLQELLASQQDPEDFFKQ